MATNESEDINWLSANLERNSEQLAIVEDARVASYGQLNEQVDAFLPILISEGISKGSRVALIGDFGVTSTALLIALIRKKAIIVPLTGQSAQKRETLFEICAVEFVIEITPDGEELTFEITKRSQIDTTRSGHKFFTEIKNRANPGLVLFTSGSTGEPKAVVHDFTLLLNKYRRTGKPLRTVNFLLFDHWGGLNTLLHTLASGGTIACPSQRNPDYICALIEKHKLELLPASPSFLNMMLISGLILSDHLTTNASVPT